MNKLQKKIFFWFGLLGSLVVGKNCLLWCSTLYKLCVCLPSKELRLPHALSSVTMCTTIRSRCVTSCLLCRIAIKRWYSSPHSNSISDCLPDHPASRSFWMLRLCISCQSFEYGIVRSSVFFFF